MANRQAFALRVSKIVSTKRISTPPSIKAAVCSLYAITTSSQVTALNPGSFTSGEIDAVLLVGPIEPATNLGLLGSLIVNSFATSQAIFAL